MHIVKASISAEDTFSDTFIPPYTTVMAQTNYTVFALSISGTWTGTLTIQRRFSDSDTWKDVDTFTSNTEITVEDPVRNVQYRIGFKTGNYSSGTAKTVMAK